MNKNYIPLYRKYRPQKLEEIVGQEHVKKALANAIETNRIAHAYLFTGPRGTGKTSSARIFAKSLNCEHGPTISPCNECENCRNITASIPIDVIEIDAASNRSVNDAEEIIQNVAMAPVHSKFKIYIIDEVHMLTPTAFNALLKTLEEPPENVIFILATTEVHKVLDTIKSRCQRFDFKRITTKDISNHLRYISDCENINITDDALDYIAQNSAGGMRDSIALLDQLSVLNSSECAIDTDDINKLLGRLSFDSLTTLFCAVANSDRQQALDVLNGIYNQGNEPVQILSNFLEYLRNLLIIKSVGTKSIQAVLQFNEVQIKEAGKNLENIETHQLVSLINKCAQYIKELKQTSNTKLWLDIAILDMSNLVENTKLEDLQKRVLLLESGSTPAVSFGRQMQTEIRRIAPQSTVSAPIQAQVQSVDAPKPHSSVNNAQASTQETKPEIQAQKASTAPTASTPAAAPIAQANTGANAASGGIKQLWESFLSSVPSFPSRAILKQQAIPVQIREDEIIIAIKNPTWLKNFSPEGERFAFLQEAAKSVFGSEPKIVVRPPQAGDDKLRQDSASSSESSSSLQPTVSPRRPLVAQTPAKEQVKEALEQADTGRNSQVVTSNAVEDLDNEDGDDIPEQTEMSNKVTLSIRPQDAAYHSDNVNMVMDLFEGKIIE